MASTFISLPAVSNGGLLSGVHYDSIILTSASTTDTFTYKQRGTTVAVVTLNYSDSTKAVLESVVRT